MTKKKVKKVSEKIETEKEIKEKNKEEYIYVYGITDKRNFDLEIKGLRDKPIKKIDFQDIVVLVSDYPILHPVLEEKEAMLHAEILNKLAKKITIIPMSFGIVFKNREILETVLSKSYETVKRILGLIDNKIELGVKIIKDELDYITDETANEILKPLNNLSVKSIKGDEFSERLLLNCSFLVEKNKFSEFSNKIAELEGKYKNLKFLYTGPWPPYSFINIKIKGD